MRHCAAREPPVHAPVPETHPGGAGSGGESAGGGRAAVHAQQALVLVNLGGAEASEILALAAEVQSGVAVQFGVTLEPEVRFVGARGDTTLQEVQACAI